MFLGRDIAQGSKYSAQTAQMIDAEVKDILETEYKRATELMTEHRESLNRIAEALMVYETIDGDELTFMRGEEMTREPPKVRMTTREDLEERMREKEKGGGPDILGPLAGGAKA